MKKKLIHLVYILLFLAICLTPAVGMAVLGPSEAVANELPVSKPKLVKPDGSINGKVPDQAEDYIAHRFAFRPSLVTWWAALNSGLLHTSVQEQVILGESGWLFYASTAEDYMGHCADAELLYRGAANLRLMQEYVQSLGAEFVFTIAPNKNSLYGEYMPREYPVGTENNAAAMEALLAEQGVSYGNLFSAFRNTDEALYFRTDSHWNGRGAALAADAILKQGGRPTAYYEGEFLAGQPHLGDLYEMLYPAGQETEADCVPAEGFTFQYATEPNGGNAIRFETDCAHGEGSLVCWRDSFGISLHPYLAQQFADAYFTRSAEYDMTLAAERNVDMVIIELVERELSRLWESAPKMPAPVREIRAERLESLTVQGACEEADEVLLQMTVCVENSLTDTLAPMYIQVGDAVYEACVFFEEGQRRCSVYVPIAAQGEPAALITEIDGSLTAYPVVLE